MAKTVGAKSNELGGGSTKEKRALLARRAERHAMILALRAERIAQGVTLVEVQRRVGIVKTMLSRLENDSTTNPTVDTLQRYAAALGKTLQVVLVDAAPVNSRRTNG